LRFSLFAALSQTAFLLVANCFSRLSAIKQTTEFSHLTTFQITTFDSKQGNMVYLGQSTLAADIDLLHPVEATEAQASAHNRPEYGKTAERSHVATTATIACAA
jgi:hypothetical protein